MSYIEQTVRIYSNGDKSWWLNGKRHRKDGPAVEYANGDKYWYLDGLRHREDRPAVEKADGYKSWYLDGLRHRTDGPAIEYANGSKSWWLNGKKLTETKHTAATKPTCNQKTVIIDGLTYKLVLEK